LEEILRQGINHAGEIGKDANENTTTCGGRDHREQNPRDRRHGRKLRQQKVRGGKAGLGSE